MIILRSKPLQKPENGLFPLVIDELLVDISTLCRRNRYCESQRATYGNKIVTGRGSIEVGMGIRRLRHLIYLRPIHT